MQILAIGVVRTLGEVTLLCNPRCGTSIPRTTDQRFSYELVVLTEPHEHTRQQPCHRDLCQPVLRPRLKGPAGAVVIERRLPLGLEARTNSGVAADLPTYVLDQECQFPPQVR